MHQITIDPKRCRSPHLCHQCEALQPGLVQACKQHGSVQVQDWVLRDHGTTVSALIACCPDRAIMIKPIN